MAAVWSDANWRKEKYAISNNTNALEFTLIILRDLSMGFVSWFIASIVRS